jgi:exopolysaccharide production protein ExoZ
VAETSVLPTAQRDRVLGVQALRFFAALSVLIGHTIDKAVDNDVVSRGSVTHVVDLPWGNGVDVFFVISGFIMYYTTRTRFGQPGAARMFLKRRVLRVVPMYWLFTLATLAAMVVFGDSMSNGKIEPGRVLASFTFVPTINDEGKFRPILALGWTLNYEMFFYVLFAIALLFAYRKGIAFLVVVFGLLTVLHPLLSSISPQLDFWSDPIILEFLLGVLLGIVRTRIRTLPLPVSLLCLAAGFVGGLSYLVIDWRGDYAHIVYVGLPVTLIVAGAAYLPMSGRSLPERALIFGGDSSYALYLSHPFAITAAVLVFEQLPGSVGGLYLLVAIVAAIVGAGVVHVLVERPLTKSLNGRFLPRSRTAVDQTEASSTPRS